MYLTEVSKQLAISDRMPVQAGQPVRIVSDRLRDEVEIGTLVMPVQTTSNVGITHRYGNMSVEIPFSMEIRQVAELMKASHGAVMSDFTGLRNCSLTLSLIA